MIKLTVAREGQRFYYPAGPYYFSPVVWCNREDIYRYILVEEDGSKSPDSPTVEEISL